MGALALNHPAASFALTGGLSFPRRAGRLLSKGGIWRAGSPCLSHGRAVLLIVLGMDGMSQQEGNQGARSNIKVGRGFSLGERKKKGKNKIKRRDH